MALLFTFLACKYPSPPPRSSPGLAGKWVTRGLLWGVGPSVPHSCLPFLGAALTHPHGWQENTKEAPILFPDLRVTVSRRLVWFPVSEPRSPAETIVVACPGGPALGTKPARSTRLHDARARALTRLPSLAAVPASTWNSRRKTNGELITLPAGGRVLCARPGGGMGSGVPLCVCLGWGAGKVSPIKSSLITRCALFVRQRFLLL